jgi:hypothetical protein
MPQSSIAMHSQNPTAQAHFKHQLAPKKINFSDSMMPVSSFEPTQAATAGAKGR